MPLVRKAVLPLFLVSGAAGLVYEVTWIRAFGVVFGNTIFAVSTVLTAFMFGMAAGSWLFGRIADKSHRPLRLFALLEIGIVLANCFTSSKNDSINFHDDLSDFFFFFFFFD